MTYNKIHPRAFAKLRQSPLYCTYNTNYWCLYCILYFNGRHWAFHGLLCRSPSRFYWRHQLKRWLLYFPCQSNSCFSKHFIIDHAFVKYFIRFFFIAELKHHSHFNKVECFRTISVLAYCQRKLDYLGLISPAASYWLSLILKVLNIIRALKIFHLTFNITKFCGKLK